MEDTKINAEIRLDLMADFARSKVGCGYVYGATGWVASPQRRAKQADQYPLKAGAILKTCKKWDGKACYDCAQLTRLSAEAGGVALPSGATGQWRKGRFSDRGDIAALPLKTVCLVFRADAKGNMAHVGLYLGDGFVVHAKSSAAGVVMEPFHADEWTHCAVFSGALEAVPGFAVTAGTGGTVNLREKPQMGAKILARVPLGTLLANLGDCDGWTRTHYLKYDGFMMSRFLKDR